MLGEWITAIESIKKVYSSWRSAERRDQVSIAYDRAEAALSHHLNFVENWSRQISLRGLPRSKPLSDVFVSLSLTERQTRISGFISSDHLLSSEFHSILLGYPGAGKTTIIKHLCQRLLHDISSAEDPFSFPVLVPLRDLRNEDTLIEYMLSLLGIDVSFRAEEDLQEKKKNEVKEDDPEKTPEARERREKQRIVAEYLNTSCALILLDGLDEMIPSHGLRVQREILQLANLLTSSKFVLTSRIGAFEVAVDNSEVLYVCPLTDQQVYTLAAQWLGSEDEGKFFLAAVDRSPYRDTIGRPLILVNLCMVYQSYGELPEQPTLIYQKVIQLLLEEWDRQRDLRRVSLYGRFGPERKRQFLGALAYDLAAGRVGSRYEDDRLLAMIEEQRSEALCGLTSDKELGRSYERIHAIFGLPIEDRNRVIAEVESHTGLFIRTGFDKFDFSHKSLQEFLCAEHICRLPNLRVELRKLVNLPDECAIATVLSASPNGFFEFLAFEVARSTALPLDTESYLLGFWSPYLTRLRVEGASFVEGPLIGMAFLSVASLAWKGEADPKLRTQGGATLVRRLCELLAQSSIRNSVLEASAAFSVKDQGADFVEYNVKTARANSLPRGMPKKLWVPKTYLEALLGLV